MLTAVHMQVVSASLVGPNLLLSALSELQMQWHYGNITEEQQKRPSPAAGADSQQQYLSTCLPHLTSGFRKAADVVFELESNVRCPAHSQLLSAFSESLCHALLASPGGEKIVKLKGCDTRDLVNILDSIYSRGRRVKSVDAAVSLTKLANSFSDGTLKAECDAFLTSAADRPVSILAPKVYSLCFDITVALTL